MSALKLQVAASFPPGTKVGVYPRVHDLFTPGQTASVKTATVEKDGNVTLSGLIEHGPYFLAAEVSETVPTPRGPEERKVWRSVAFNASNPAPALDGDAYVRQTEAELQARADVLAKTSIDTATNPSTTAPATGTIIEGPRNTGNVSTIGATPAIAKTVPFPRIEDQKKGTPLRSHTQTGEAHPVPTGERQPKPSQDDIAKGTKQRSDTPVGEATPVDPAEQQPAVRQEDISARTPQASDTETGEAVPTQAEEPRSTRRRSPSTRSATKSAKRQKADRATSTGRAQARSQAARTTKRGKGK